MNPANIVDVMMLPSGEWYGFPRGWLTPRQQMRLMEAVRNGGKPEDAGLRIVGEWRTMGWPEGAKEAEYEA